MTIAELLAIAAAFLGLALPGAPTGAAHECPSGAPDGYANDWYAWEWCLFGNEYDPNTNQLTNTQTTDLVRRIWNTYEPWATRALIGTYEGLAWDGEWYYRQPRTNRLAPPRVVFGQTAAHCDGLDGCTTGSTGETNYTYAGVIGWNYETGRDDLYGLWWTDLTYHPDTIHLPRNPNLILVLHEIAHVIDSHQWWIWDDDDTTTRTLAEVENERTDGHGLAFRCLALDLYWTHTTLIPGEVYAMLSDLCDLYAPNYARPDQPNLNLGS